MSPPGSPGGHLEFVCRGVFHVCVCVWGAVPQWPLSELAGEESQWAESGCAVLRLLSLEKGAHDVASGLRDQVKVESLHILRRPSSVPVSEGLQALKARILCV